MSDKPLVSVIIPAYNEAKVAPRCIDSVLAQTYDNLEVILVDDGSVDATGDIFDGYARRDKRVKALRQRNGGAGAARNAGLDAATGTFVLFIDADDRISEDYAAALVDAIGDADMAVCGFRMTVMDGDAEISGQNAVPPTSGVLPIADYIRIYGAIDDRIGMLIMHSQCNKLFRLARIRDAGISFPTDMSCWEDGLFTMKYAALCRKVAVSRAVSYEYIFGTSPDQAAGGNVYRPRGAEDALRAGRFFAEAFKDLLSPGEMNERLGAFASYLIVNMVNMSRRDAQEPGSRIVAGLDELIALPDVRQWFRHYRPKPGQSRLIPLLVKWRLPRLLFVVARHKADKRYGAHYGRRAEERRGLRRFS